MLPRELLDRLYSYLRCDWRISILEYFRATRKPLRKGLSEAQWTTFGLTGLPI